MELEKRPILYDTARMANNHFSPSEGEHDDGYHAESVSNLKRAPIKRSRILTIVICVLLLLIIVVILILIFKQGRNEYVVETYCGLVQGVKESTTGGASAIVFKGIPYAKPPVGGLRWKPPESLGQKESCWEGTLQATKFQVACAQPLFKNGSGETGSEDCLYLNIWTPKISGDLKLPVMVWIHGGDLIKGSSSYEGNCPNVELVSSLNIVAVSMGYRLNAFGFLALDILSKQSPSKTSGNYGFMDQILALRWVKSNIARFGGDPDLVTVVGQNSGGTSLYGLLASKKVNGLFKRAVIMSGSPIFNKTTKEASKDNEIFLKRSNCSMTNDKEKLECIYELSQTEVLQAISWKQYPSWAMSDLEDLPKKYHFDGAVCVVDGDVVLTPPGNLNTYPPIPNKIEVMIGSTAQEIDFAPSQNFRRKPFSSFVAYANKRLGTFSSSLANNAIDLYRKLLHSTSSQLLYTTIASDIRVTCPTNSLSSNLSMTANLDVYRYIVTNKPSTSITFAQPYMTNYSVHVWDSSAFFGFHGLPFKFVPRKRDLAFKEAIRREFLNFFKNGRPSMPYWKTYPSSIGVFGNDALRVEADYHKQGCNLWNELNLFPYGWIN